MLVERSKLQKLMAMESLKVAKKPAGKEVAQSASKSTFKPIEKKPPVPEEILLDEDNDDDGDQKKKTDDSLKMREPFAKSANEDKPEVSTHVRAGEEKSQALEKSDDPEEILLADDEEDEVTIGNEVAMDEDEATSTNQLQQLKRKHEDVVEVESKRMRKTIQG